MCEKISDNLKEVFETTILKKLCSFCQLDIEHESISHIVSSPIANICDVCAEACIRECFLRTL